MPFIGLTPYSVRIREKNKRKVPFLNLSSFDGSTDFLDVFRTTVLGPGIKSVPDQANKTFEALPSVDKDRVLDGVFSVGQSGYGSTIKDGSGAQPFKRTVKHSEFIPMYYRLNNALKDETFAILMLQSFNKTGLKGLLDKRIKQRFMVDFPEYTIHINRILTKGMAQSIFAGSPLKKVRFIQRQVPKDIADKFGTHASQHEGEIELVLKAKGDNPFGLRSAVEEFFSGKRKLTDIIEFSDLDYETVKLEIEVDGKKRTLSLSNMDSLNNTFDISDEVVCDADEHPKLDSIRAIAIEYESDLAP